MSKNTESKRLAALEAAVAALEAALVGHNGGAPLDEPTLLPDRLVAQRYSITTRTLERWDKEPGLGFPPPVYIRRRRFREVAALDAWDRVNARKDVDPHSTGRTVAQGLPRISRGRFGKTRTIEAR